MNLSAENVEKLFSTCLSESAPSVEGVISSARLTTAGHDADIRQMLSELPAAFRQSGGGGWSFLNACLKSDGEQWTGLHETVEKLVLLGIASGSVAFLMPREMWAILPGGMPYFVIKDTVEEVVA